MSDSSSINNIRVHLKDIPEFFSKQLKSFITRQPDFNEELQHRLGLSDKAVDLLSQKIGDMERNTGQLSEEIAELRKTVKQLRGG